MVRGKADYALSKRGYHFIIDEVSAWIVSSAARFIFEGEEVVAIQDLVKTLDSKLIKANLARPS